MNKTIIKNKIIYPEESFCVGNIKCNYGKYINDLNFKLSVSKNVDKKSITKLINDTKTFHCNNCKATEYMRYSLTKSHSS